jgi:phage-related protein
MVFGKIFSHIGSVLKSFNGGSNPIAGVAKKVLKGVTGVFSHGSGQGAHAHGNVFTRGLQSVVNFVKKPLTDIAKTAFTKGIGAAKEEAGNFVKDGARALKGKVHEYANKAIGHFGGEHKDKINAVRGKVAGGIMEAADKARNYISGNNETNGKRSANPLDQLGITKKRH